MFVHVFWISINHTLRFNLCCCIDPDRSSRVPRTAFMTSQPGVPRLRLDLIMAFRMCVPYKQLSFEPFGDLLWTRSYTASFTYVNKVTTTKGGVSYTRQPGHWDCKSIPLQWRHNGRNNVSNHQPHDCLLNRLFRRRSKKTSKLRVTGLCAGKMASYAENVSIWWRHHAIFVLI